MNLFNNLIQKKTDIEKLRICIKMLIEQIRFTSKRIRDIVTRNQYDKIIPINLEYLKNSMLSTDWFFVENDLYGANISDASTKGGLYTTLNKIEGLNLCIDNYNREFDQRNRDNIKKIIQYWEPSRGEVDILLIYFKSIVTKCDIFLSKIS